MRDLEQYLPSFKKEKYLRGRSGHDTESESVTIEAIERAIKAEAEVERLTEINQGCESEAHLYDDLLHRCRTENAQLRKVVDAARAHAEMHNAAEYVSLGDWLKSVDDLRDALAELDGEGKSK